MLMVTDTGSSCDGTGHTLVRKPCTMLTPGLVKYNSCSLLNGKNVWVLELYMVTRCWLLLCSGETRHPGAGPRGKVALEPSDMVAR